MAQDSVRRLEAVGKLVNSVKASYPEAKVLTVKVDWRVLDQGEFDDEDLVVVPVVTVHVELPGKEKSDI